MNCITVFLLSGACRLDTLLSPLPPHLATAVTIAVVARGLASVAQEVSDTAT
jgi:hypothetical protein